MNHPDHTDTEEIAPPVRHQVDEPGIIETIMRHANCNRERAARVLVEVVTWDRGAR